MLQLLVDVGRIYMFTTERKKAMESAWNCFVEKGDVEEFSCKVRDIILQSWIRSKSYGVNPLNIVKTIISNEELQIRLNRHKNLINIARPYMQNIYNFVKGSGCVVILSDEEGYLLEVIGDNDIMENAQITKLVVGANRNEKQVGTNAIGTCLFLDQPLQVWAEEHYFINHHSWACSAAPIHDNEGVVIGCLDLSGPWHNIHSHTLGMVVAAVDAIEKELRVKKAYEKIFLANSQFKATLESISEGIILINARGIIQQINKYALRMFGLNLNQVEQRDIKEVLNCDDFFNNIISSDKNIFDQEKIFNIYGFSLNCTVSAVIIRDEQGLVDGLVITLKEIKAVHRLINKMTGSQAYFTFDNIIGKSKAINESIRLANIAAKSLSNVLLLGESGTGKELFAQAIHNKSERRDGPFIAINCGALPRGLIESELFGYEGGSFTGSRKEGRPGKFELADGGTIFLDEIGDMPLEVQVSLLRVLQNREVLRVGCNKVRYVDVRIVAATNTNLEEAVANRVFRNDLYYRLNVFSIHIPPLRERKEDVELLTDYFIGKYSKFLGKRIKGISTEVNTVLKGYNWPGNVRELENVIERAINITQNDNITVSDLPPYLTGVSQEYSIPVNTEEKHSSIKDLERNVIIDALEKYNGNVKKAAESIGIARRTIYRRLEEYNVDYTKYRKL